MSNKQSWKSYEDVARYFLNHFQQEFGLERIDPKQKIAGSSGRLEKLMRKGCLKVTTAQLCLLSAGNTDPNNSIRKQLGDLHTELLIPVHRVA